MHPYNIYRNQDREKSQMPTTTTGNSFPLICFDCEIAPNTPSTPISSYSPQISMPPTKPNNRFLSFLLQVLVMALVISLFFLFVGIAVLVLLHIFIAGRALRRRPQFPRYPNSPYGLSPKDLQKLPCFDYGGAETAAAFDCAVCLENLRRGDRCRVLPGCRHVFHAACVDAWLVKVPACPVCRAGVAGIGGFGCEAAGSEEGRVGSVGV